MDRTLMWATQGFPNQFDCQSKLRPRRQRFEPGEIEDVVIAAADELDAAVAGLDGGEVAVVFGAGVAEWEQVAVDAVHDALFAAGGNETFVGQNFAVDLERSLPLPPVVFLQHRAWRFAVQPGFGFGIAFEKGIPEGGAEGEDDAMVIRVLLEAFAG